mgnify:CR=1 FL=1
MARRLGRLDLALNCRPGPLTDSNAARTDPSSHSRRSASMTVAHADPRYPSRPSAPRRACHARTCAADRCVRAGAQVRTWLAPGEATGNRCCGNEAGRRPLPQRGRSSTMGHLVSGRAEEAAPGRAADRKAGDPYSSDSRSGVRYRRKPVPLKNAELDRRAGQRPV